MKPTASPEVTSTVNSGDVDIEFTGEVVQLRVDPNGSKGDVVAVAYATTEDGKTVRMWLRIDAAGARYLRERIEDATPTPAAVAQGMGPDSRVFRTELVWAETDQSAWSQKAGWSLFVDAELIAHTGEKLSADDAQAWADTQLAASMRWLPGHETSSFYWVASPAACRA
ncbi:hypothetical protein [Amycolatopsis sp. cg9]|uniref:hypothetical protein n=1 Tax=Amycolatopsis sp. cg9 TaxID=3238801 RepID=UPI0035257374